MGKKNKIRFCRLLFALIIFLASFLVTLYIYSQGESPETPAAAHVSLWELLLATGLVGILQLLLSVTGTALVIEAFLSIKLDKLAPPYLIGEFEKLFEEQEFDEIMNLCETDNSFLSNVISGAISRLSSGYDEMKSGLEEAIEQETLKLNAKISYINLIGQLSPLLGLLGTITGIISTFQVIAAKPVTVPRDLAKGIYEALVTTVIGILGAATFLTLYFILKNKIDKLSTSVSIVAHELVGRCKAMQE